MTGGDALLDVADLRVTFRPPTGPVAAVRGVDFSLPRGKVLGVVGESGSGKSATFRALLGLAPPSAEITGTARFAGEPVQPGSDALRDASAMIYQNPGAALNPVFTIGQQLALAINARSGAKGDAAVSDLKAEAVSLLEQVGLPDPEQALRAYPHEFSGGMRQRGVIALALAKQPQLLVADEPTTALDVTTQHRILDLLDQLRDRHDLSIAFISHDLAVVRSIADDILVMRQGQVVEAGRTDDVLTNPQHEYTQRLLDAQPDGGGASQDRATDAGPLIAIKDLTVDYRSRERRGAKVRVIDGLDLNVRAGETLALVGESGSGKSTLANAVVGLVAATGSIRYDGSELVGVSRRARRGIQQRMQIVFQNPLLSLNPRMRVAQQLHEPMQVHTKLSAEQRAARIEATAADLELDMDLLGRFPHELSGGQAQRVVLARALLLEPECVVFDEATSALDVSVQAAVLDLLTRLKVERQLTYLFITHDLAVARQIADRIAVMRRGEIVELASAEAVFTNPAHDYTRELLASVPV